MHWLTKQLDYFFRMWALILANHIDQTMPFPALAGLAINGMDVRETGESGQTILNILIYSD